MSDKFLNLTSKGSTTGTLEKQGDNKKLPPKLHVYKPVQSGNTLNPKLVLASILSGFIPAMSMPGLNFSLFAWAGLIPLILIINKTRSAKISLVYSFSFGLGYFFLSLNWLFGLHPLNWMGISTAQSLGIAGGVWFLVSMYAASFMGIFGLATHFILKTRLFPIFKSILIAISWSLIMNKFMGLGEFGFPWSMIEYSQYHNLPLLQFAQYIGGIGIGFFIVFINCLGAFILDDSSSKINTLKLTTVKTITLVISILLLHLAGYGLLISNQKPDKKLTATIIQTSSTIEEEKTGKLSLDKTKKYLLGEIKKAPSGIVIIPEAAIFDFLRVNSLSFHDELEKIAFTQKKTLIIGTLDMDFNQQGLLSPTNSALILDKVSSRIDNIYHKQYIVPFGEYLPCPQLIPEWIKSLLVTKNQTDYLRGNTTKVIPSSNGNIAPSICYELVFPEISKYQTKNNANVLVNIANLAWFHNSIIKDQFVAFGTMRAAESRRPVIMSVNGGNSAFIDFTGKIIEILPKNTYKSVSREIGYSNEDSWYSKHFF